MSTSFRAICTFCKEATYDQSHTPIKFEELYDFIWQHKCKNRDFKPGRQIEIIDEYNPRYWNVCNMGHEHDQTEGGYK